MRVKLSGGLIDAREGKLATVAQGQLLQTLKVVVEQATTLLEEGVTGSLENAPEELGGSVADHGALGDLDRSQRSPPT